MKKIIFIIFISTLLFPLSTFAKSECSLPYSADYRYEMVTKVEKEIFIVKDSLVFVFFYEMKNSEKNKIAKFHYKNFIKQAKLNWGEPISVDVDDLWDKNGRQTPYLLIEFGGNIDRGLFYPKSIFSKIGTCYDRQVDKPDFLFLVFSSEYEEMVTRVEEIFVPILVFQDVKEK